MARRNAKIRRSIEGTSGTGSRMDNQHEGHIVVVGQWREGQGYVPAPYARAVAAAGGRPVIFSTFDLPSHQLPDGISHVERVDPDDATAIDGAAGLVLPGGGDIDPRWYGREPHPATHNVNHRRDRYERTLLEAALERDVPVLAICHGMQMLNVHLGGTLDQNLADEPGRLRHDHEAPTPEPVHDVQVAPNTLLAEAVGGGRLPVNSHHHQGLDVLALPLAGVAWAEDGVLEAVVSREHSWVVGVQWHPEVMAAIDPRQGRLFEGLVRAAAAYRGEVTPAAS
ncbi:MAG TPA: gamma-glutamyl-gamma-aminobutyrate hydrolase family protein [Actinomycetota bacterium]|nr:gamma-glutamyl-gamma-aminobutyrate hydrolase family protein [Actinomycetota bacterium]